MSGNTNTQASGSLGGNPSQNSAGLGQTTQNTSGSSTTHPKIDKINTCDNPPVDRVPEPLDNENWVVWRERITPIFKLCSVKAYVEGTIPRPMNDTAQAENWDFNDNYTKVLIQNNISSSQTSAKSEKYLAHLNPLKTT